MTLIEFVTITEEKVKKELKNKQGLEDTSIITLKLRLIQKSDIYWRPAIKKEKRNVSV